MCLSASLSPLWDRWEAWMGDGVDIQIRRRQDRESAPHAQSALDHSETAHCADLAIQNKPAIRGFTETFTGDLTREVRIEIRQSRDMPSCTGEDP